ncbi:FAD-dependent oxidoreductase [Sphingobium cupriresistens]|uniref:2-polyprenyl-6-methoxyphenol hydroxylase n=1 Tax=Sphingobium cupriresistens TaxID=1132417 RepID=A0A8G2DXP8_9SPHN|nr:FAD-dependent oxidoreductase [Sphingobium cupriresistens]RYM10680.1 2-polyprenyl-6-methoxyphenol hydroxylase [Sphingobium cupriresistens]
MRTIDVLTCGAGAAGLALAIDLARCGVSFRLIEKREAPFTGSRGKGIQPRTQEVFEDLGVIDRLMAIGGVYPPLREYRDDGSFIDKEMFTEQPSTTAEPYTTALMVPQFLTERILRERLAEFGRQVEFGCELIAFTQDEDGVTARIARTDGEETIRARYLVGADGGRSYVRDALGIGFPGKTLGVRAMMADVMLDGLSRDVWHQFNEGDMAWQISACPLAGTDLFQLQAPVPLNGDVDLSVEGLNRMLGERTGRSDVRVFSISWASAYVMNARLADRYRVGRILLIGDAAHIHPPTGGQGLNTSVQDAYNLGWKLAAVLGGAPCPLLESYEEERRPIAAAMLGLSTVLLEQAKRGNMVRGREVRQLDLGYRGLSLALDAVEAKSGPTAGDRMPDVVLRGAGGQTRRLFDLMRGPHWTLLVGSSQQALPVSPRPGLHVWSLGPGGAITDPDSGLGLCNGEALLIRPDGYVGARTVAHQQDRLEAYLESVIPPPST